MGMFDFSPDDRWFWSMLFGGLVGHPFFLLGQKLYWSLKAFIKRKLK